MKVLLISQNERHAFLLEQLAEESNEVRLLCKFNTGAWQGLVPRVASLEEALEWRPDVSIIDSPGFGTTAKILHEAGLRVFGGSPLQDRLASDSIYGMGLLEQAGVLTPEQATFARDDVAEASAYVQGKNHPWLLQCPDGAIHNTDGPTDMQLLLEQMRDTLPHSFTLRRGFPTFVNATLMVRPTYYLVGLFNGEGLMNPALKLTIASNLLPDGQGVPTVEGVTLRAVSATDEVVQDTLKRLDHILKPMGYTGFCFLGCVEEKGRTVVVDFQSSPPDGFWAAFYRGLTMSLNKFLERILSPRRALTPYDFQVGWVCSRKLTLPPYPATEATWLSLAGRGLLSQGIPHTVLRHERWGVYWNDVFKREDGLLQACGPLVGYAVGRGATYYDAEREARKIALSLPIDYLQMKAVDELAAFNLG